MLAAALALLAPGSGAPAERDVTPALMGSWGGPHAKLMVGSLDTDVQLDCAGGTIYGPYFVRKDGRFTWDGKFTPVHDDLDGPEVDATYEGVFRGGDLTLKVTVDGGRKLGPFTLERFRDAELPSCD